MDHGGASIAVVGLVLKLSSVTAARAEHCRRDLFQILHRQGIGRLRPNGADGHELRHALAIMRLSETRSRGLLLYIRWNIFRGRRRAAACVVQHRALYPVISFGIPGVALNASMLYHADRRLYPRPRPQRGRRHVRDRRQQERPRSTTARSRPAATAPTRGYTSFITAAGDGGDHPADGDEVVSAGRAPAPSTRSPSANCWTGSNSSTLRNFDYQCLYGQHLAPGRLLYFSTVPGRA